VTVELTINGLIVLVRRQRLTPLWLLLENCLNELHRSNSRRFALPMIASENG
jgi:hypothetical protein